MLQELWGDLKWYYVDHRATMKHCRTLPPNEKVYKTADLIHEILDPARNTFTVRCNKTEVVLSYRITDTKTKTLTNGDVDFCAGIAKTMINATTRSRLVGKDVQLRFDTTLDRVERAQDTEAVRQLQRLFWNAVACAVLVYFLLKLLLLIVADALDAGLLRKPDDAWEIDDEPL
tara:strand:+ start:360 stop:881 length:522 start_codon:yes stop_codon:yes gene_type:complete